MLLNNNNYKEIDDKLKIILDSDLTEGNEGLIEDFFIAIDRTIYNSIQGIQNFLNKEKITLEDNIKYTTRTEYLKTIKRQKTKVDKLVDKHIDQAVKILPLKVPVTDGLSVDLITVLNKLEVLSTYFKDNNNYFDDIEDRFFAILEAQDFTKVLPSNDVINNINNISNVIKTDVESLYNNNYQDTMTIRKAILKLNNIKIVNNKILELGQTYNIEVLNKILDRTNGITEEIKQTLKAISKEKISKQELQQLSNYIKGVSLYITSLGTLYYIFMQTSGTTVEINNKIIENITK